MQHHGYKFSDLENMLPWERDAYLALVVNWVQEENERMKQRNA